MLRTSTQHQHPATRALLQRPPSICLRQTETWTNCLPLQSLVRREGGLGLGRVKDRNRDGLECAWKLCTRTSKRRIGRHQSTRIHVNVCYEYWPSWTKYTHTDTDGSHVRLGKGETTSISSNVVGWKGNENLVAPHQMWVMPYTRNTPLRLGVRLGVIIVENLSTRAAWTWR